MREQFLEGPRTTGNFACPERLWTELKVIAARKRRPVGEVVLEAVLASPAVQAHLAQLAQPTGDRA